MEDKKTLVLKEGVKAEIYANGYGGAFVRLETENGISWFGLAFRDEEECNWLESNRGDIKHEATKVKFNCEAVKRGIGYDK